MKGLQPVGGAYKFLLGVTNMKSCLRAKSSDLSTLEFFFLTQSIVSKFCFFFKRGSKNKKAEKMWQREHAHLLKTADVAVFKIN